MKILILSRHFKFASLSSFLSETFTHASNGSHPYCHCEERSDEPISKYRLPRLPYGRLAMTKSGEIAAPPLREARNDRRNARLRRARIFKKEISLSMKGKLVFDSLCFFLLRVSLSCLK
jgi:hypothetical protein